MGLLTCNALKESAALHVRSLPSAAAEWAKPYKSAAALRPTACEIIITPICGSGLRTLHMRIWNMLRGGVWDADFQLCVFLVHVGKLLRKVAFFPKSAYRRKVPPPDRREESQKFKFLI